MRFGISSIRSELESGSRLAVGIGVGVGVGIGSIIRVVRAGDIFHRLNDIYPGNAI